MHQMKLPWLRVALFTAVTLAAAISLTQLTFDPAPTISAPDDDFFRALEASEARFLSNDFVVITIEHPDIYSEDAIRRIADVTDAVSNLETVSAALSFATLAKVDVDSGYELEPVVEISDGITDEEISDLKRFLEEQGFISELTTTIEEDGASVVVFPVDGSDPIAMAGDVFEATDAEGIPREHIFGSPVMQYYAARDNVHDSASLLILALVVVFVVEWIVTRRLPLALVLWWSAVTSVIWTMALLILFNIKLSVETMVIPVTVLALATSYGIHIHRYHATHSDDKFWENVRKATSIVLVAGITTLAGFASLAVSRLPTLRTIGLVCATGVGFAMISALFYMAPLYERVSKRYTVRPSLFRGARPRATKSIAIIVVLACFATGVGALRLYINPRFSTAFRRNSEPTQAMRYFESHYFAGDTVELHLDTGVEYGLVSMESYDSVRSIVSRLSEIDGIAGIYAFTHIIEWFHGGRPESAVDIGEALEMLTGSEGGLNIGAFIDVTYSATKIIIRPEPSSTGHREFSETIDHIEMEIDSILASSGFEGTSIVGGSSPYIRRVNTYFADGQITGVVAFIVAVFLVAIIFLRNLRLAMVALVAPLLSSLVYIGIVGWSGEPMNVTASVGFATILGVSVDDIMYFLLYHRNLARSRLAAPINEAITKAGPAIIETTVVLVCGVSVLLTSRYLNLAWAGIYIIVGLITPTVVTLELVPFIMGRKRSTTEDATK